MRGMAKPLRNSCSVVAVSVAILIGLRQAQTVFAQTGAGRLTIQLTNVTDEAVVDYDRVVAPVVPAEGGTSSVPVICYSGVAVVLGLEDCGTNSLRVESSRDLTNWVAFPQPGFQLTLGTNSGAIIPVTGSYQFFRAAWN